MDASQITGTASSYARKYALNGLFALDDAKDPDEAEPQKRINKKTVQWYVAEFLAAIEAEDGGYMLQLGDELKDTPEHSVVWSALDSNQKKIVKRLCFNHTRQNTTGDGNE
jgi:hypothetical protein